MPPRIPTPRLGLSLPSLFANNATCSCSTLNPLILLPTRTLSSRTPPNRSAVSDILNLGKAEPAPHISYQQASSMIRETNERAAAQYRNLPDRDQQQLRATVERAVQARQSETYMRYMTRKWNSGDVYAPHDLSGDEARKNKRTRKMPDLVDLYGLKPLDMYKNFNFLAYFMTPGGQIQHSNISQLRPVNQRKVAKAIRRAIGMGLMPSVHRHPEILKYEFRNKSNYRAFQMLLKARLKPGLV